MIIEELVSRMGFEVAGVQKLRTAVKEWDKAKKSVTASSKAMVVAGKSTTVAATGVSRLGTALRSTVAILARLIAVAAGVAAGVAAVGTAFVVASVRAARARREFGLLAKTLGSKAQNLETTTNFLRYLGLGDDAKADTQKAVGAVNDILKTIRAGGEEADEARKKFAGLKLDEVFRIDPRTGQMRDAAAVLLDIVAAYKQLQEQAGAYRKQADDIAKKQPKKASQLRQKALDLDRKGTKLADEAGIDGKLKVLLDEKTWKQITEAFATAASQRPTTSDAAEARKKEVSDQAEAAGLKAEALMKNMADRLLQIGDALAVHVLPPLNAFLDKLIAFGKSTGLIPENVGEKSAREAKERLDIMAAGRRAERETREATPQEIRNKTQRELVEQQDAEFRKRYGTPTTAPLPPQRPRPLPARDKDTSPAKQPQRTPTTAIRETQADLPAKLEALRNSLDANAKASGTGWLDYFRKMLSPEVNAAKLQKTAEQKTVNQTDFGNDQRTITNNVTVNGAPQEGLAAAVSGAVNQAVSRIKASNASTAGAGVP